MSIHYNLPITPSPRIITGQPLMINSLILPEFLLGVRSRGVGGEDVCVLSLVKRADLIKILFEQRMRGVVMRFQRSYTALAKCYGL